MRQINLHLYIITYINGFVVIYIVCEINVSIDGSMDFLNELGELALGSRLKRMSERMLADAALVYQHYEIDAQPKWFTLLALLDKRHQITVVEAAELLGLSQPALSQFSQQLKTKGLINVSTGTVDSRKKFKQLSNKGKEVVDKMRPVWTAVDLAAKQMCEQYENQFYQSLNC